MTMRRLMRREAERRVHAAARRSSGSSRNGERSCPRRSGPAAVARGDLPEEFDLAQGPASALGHGTERIFRDMHRQAGFLREEPIESAQEGAAARQHEAAV